MRELTIQEKAKAYDKLKVKAQELTKDGYIDNLALVDMFPELADSEDEKIRKALVDYFTAYKEQKECGIKTFYGIPTDDILAWLEKQGEQKPNYCHHEVDLSGCSEEYRKAYYDGWNNCNQQHAQLEAEQKPWSKDDNDMMKSIIEDVHCGADFRADVIREANEKEDWLKSIRRRYISLKNTCNWEPTEEKMEALKAATYCKDQAMSKVLFELYQDLEKVIKVRNDG